MIGRDAKASFDYKLFDLQLHCPTSSSIIRLPTRKRKRLVVRPTKRARTPPPAPPSSPLTSSFSSSSSSLAPSSEPETKIGRVVPPIVCEEEEE